MKSSSQWLLTNVTMAEKVISDSKKKKKREESMWWDSILAHSQDRQGAEMFVCLFMQHLVFDIQWFRNYIRLGFSSTSFYFYNSLLDKMCLKHSYKKYFN